MPTSTIGAIEDPDALYALSITHVRVYHRRPDASDRAWHVDGYRRRTSSVAELPWCVDGYHAGTYRRTQIVEMYATHAEAIHHARTFAARNHYSFRGQDCYGDGFPTRPAPLTPIP